MQSNVTAHCEIRPDFQYIFTAVQYVNKSFIRIGIIVVIISFTGPAPDRKSKTLFFHAEFRVYIFLVFAGIEPYPLSSFSIYTVFSAWMI